MLLKHSLEGGHKLCSLAAGKYHNLLVLIYLTDATEVNRYQHFQGASLPGIHKRRNQAINEGDINYLEAQKYIFLLT